MPPPRAPSWGYRLRFQAKEFACLLFLLTLSCVGAASEPAELASVHVMLVGRIADDPTVGQRISSWFDENEYRVLVRQVPRLDTERVLAPEADGSVYVWVTLPTDAEARVYFATVPPGRDTIYSLRVLTLENGLDEMGAERLSQVIHLSSVALFEGRGEHDRADVERMLEEEPRAVREAKPRAVTAAPPVPRPELARDERPVKVARASRERRVGARFGVGYGGSYRSSEGYWHGPRGRAALVLGPVGFGVSVQAYLPHTEEIPEDAPELRIRFSGVGIDVQSALHDRVLSWLEMEYLLGLGVDVVRYEPLAGLDPRVTAGEVDREVRPNVVGAARAVVRGSWLKWALLLQCGFALNRTHYYLIADLTRREVARPSRILPLLAIEATF